MQHAKAIDPENPRVIINGDSKVANGTAIFLQLVITIVTSIFPGLILLWLFHTKRTSFRIYITIGLAAILGIILRGLANAKMKEIFIATAAYVTRCPSHIRLLTIFRFTAVEGVFIGTAKENYSSG